jgi:DNA polymerase alpha subunit B
VHRLTSILARCCHCVLLAAAAQSSPQVVVVNPGRLAKGSSGGTYAHITVAAGSGSLASRCRVDIVRV